MRVSRDELQRFTRKVAPPPAPVEPLLAAAQEAALLADAKRDDPRIAARRARVVALLRRPAPPEGSDAELVALLAAARALPLERRDDQTTARLRLREIGGLKDPPPEVRKLLDRLGLKPGDSEAFANALLPPTHHIGDFYESGTGMHAV